VKKACHFAGQGRNGVAGCLWPASGHVRKRARLAIAAGVVPPTPASEFGRGLPRAAWPPIPNGRAAPLRGAEGTRGMIGNLVNVVNSMTGSGGVRNEPSATVPVRLPSGGF
jgi:hypothetical protein